MCDYYVHIHSCKHTTSALGRLCPAAALIQTPCRNIKTWQTISVPEGCEDCGGAALAEATPRTPQVERQHREGTSRKDWRHGKEGKEERKKFVKKVPGKFTRRS